MPDRLNRIETELTEVRRWQERHEERHGDDADMLGRVLDSLTEHLHNHHGRVSQAKQAAVPVGLISLLAIIAEVIRQVWF